MDTLGLTTPLRTGEEVEHAQRLLADDGNRSRFGNFHPGPADGEFGEMTARACKRAKYWLGYPTAKIAGTYGDRLDGFLTGRRDLPYLYVLRRARRKRRAARTPLREKALARARSQIGVKESPAGSNNVLYSRWYRGISPANGWAWCAMFVTWCYVLEGAKGFARGSRWAYTPFMLFDARAGRNGLAVVRDPQPGDVVLYDWDKLSGPPAMHVGLFERWTDRGAGRFTAIEGNTAVGNDSNGGAVMRRDRSTSQVAAFVHVSS